MQAAYSLILSVLYHDFEIGQDPDYSINSSIVNESGKLFIVLFNLSFVNMVFFLVKIMLSGSMSRRVTGTG